MLSVEDLKNAKKAKKITLQEISDLSHIPKRTVDKIFSGVTENPRIDTIEAIAKALGLSEDGSKNSVPKGYDLTEKEKRLLDAFRALIPSLQDYLIETAEKLVEASSNGSKIEKRKA